MAEIVCARGLRHVYADGTCLDYGPRPFRVAQGERVAILGPNGGGKSTLLYHLLGLLEPTAGEVRVFGVAPARGWEKIRQRIGVVLQDPDQQIIAPTVRDDLAFSPRNYGLPSAEADRLVREVADELEIADLLDKVPHYLSGGQRQRVALAGALVLKPDLLVLDEPLESLDAHAKRDLIALLNRLHSERGMALVVTLHDVNLTPRFIDTVYVLAQGGAIVERGTPEQIFAQPELLAHHRLEPPVLGMLFQELRRRGHPVEPALTIERAVEQLDCLLERRHQASHAVGADGVPAES
ncbi:MAG: ATP-binding cassette domain-containing protein [Chloroflexi bacterium]|nr:ATP-binding cassette domain-containing protein [Chloroflexota bacterium]